MLRIDTTDQWVNLALRWRTKLEVISGKGELICSNKNCSSKDSLTSWEINFKYSENGQSLNSFVKLNTFFFYDLMS
ncbi:protein FRA10AC1 homolog isoform X2 [Copidosoma floridanum]|uniref:protein FRA10AC1 homolog isoform X2 n=1 Tax=Copidosoma floridanum TaxID=29053 RepID=UPI0006C93C83|nr:protein FRA10AC1 homolog isoform X2 [Copidosoma floridanum]